MSAPIFWERFEGASGADEETWTDTSVGTGCAITKRGTGTSVRNVMGWGSWSIELDRAATGWDCQKWVDFGTPTTTAWYAHVEIIVDAESLGNSETVPLFSFIDTGATNPVMAQLSLRQGSSGNLRFRWSVRLGGDAGGMTNYDSDAIAIDTPYSLEVLYDIANAAHGFRLDGLEVANVTTGMTAYTQIERFHLGADSSETQSATTILYDRISIGEDRWWHLKGPNTGAIGSITFNGDEFEQQYMVGTGKLTKAAGVTPDEFKFTLRPGGNRLRYSEDISQAEWTLVGATAGSATSLDEDTSTGEHYVEQEISTPAGVDTLISSRVTPSSAREISIRLMGSDGSFAGARVDDTGTVVTGATGNGVVLLSGADLVSAGVYHLWAVVRLSADEATPIFRLNMFNGGLSYTGTSESVTVTRHEADAFSGISTDMYLKTTTDPAERPVDRALTKMYVDWTEQDGVQYFDDGTAGHLEFEGHVVRYTEQGVGVGNESGTLKVRCLGLAWSVSRERFDVTAPEQAAELGMKDIVDDNVAGSGYTATGNDTMPTVASRDYVRATVPEMVEDHARRAGVLWRVFPGSNFEMWQVGDAGRNVIIEFNRDRHEGMLTSQPIWDRRVDQLVNRQYVIGADGAFDLAEDTDSQTAYGIHDGADLEFGNIYDTGDLEQIADAIIASQKDPIIDGKNIKTQWHRIEPGYQAFYSDRAKGLAREPVNIRGVTLEQNEAQQWNTTVDLTTESLIDVISPISEKQRSIIDDEDEFLVIDAPNTITNPNNTIPTTLANGDIAVHFRYDSGTRVFRIELHAGDTATAAMSIAFRAIITPREASTISTALADVTGEGKTLNTKNNGTTRIDVESAGAAGVYAKWTVGNVAGGTVDRAELTWPASPTIERGEVQFYFATSDTPVFRGFTYGDTLLAAGVGYGKPILVKLPMVV